MHSLCCYPAALPVWITFLFTYPADNANPEKTSIMKHVTSEYKSSMLDIQMIYNKEREIINKHIVDNQTILIEHNNENGYYFKFGIYRVGNSTVPVCYNLVRYKEY